jgi:hypothetical protein
MQASFLQKRLGQLSEWFLRYGLHKSLRLFCVYFCFDKFLKTAIISTKLPFHTDNLNQLDHLTSLILT